MPLGKVLWSLVALLVQFFFFFLALPSPHHGNAYHTDWASLLQEWTYNQIWANLHPLGKFVGMIKKWGGNILLSI